MADGGQQAEACGGDRKKGIRGDQDAPRYFTGGIIHMFMADKKTIQAGDNADKHEYAKKTGKKGHSGPYCRRVRSICKGKTVHHFFLLGG